MSDASLAQHLRAAYGFHVFPADHPGHPRCIGRHGPTSPCDGKRGKHPAVAFSTWAVAATDKMIDLEWRKHGGRANPAVACGPSGLVVFDGDKRGEILKWAVTEGISLPPTYTVHTARGEHMYFRWDHDRQKIGNSAKAVKGFAIDIRGDGGYVIAEGAAHETGVTYTANNLLVADLPAEVAALLLAGTTPAPPETSQHGDRGGDSPVWETVAGPTDDPNTARIGFRDRHEALVAYAGRLLAKGLDYTEALAVYRQRWLLCEQPAGQIPEATYHSPDCPYPVTWTEAEAKLADVYGRYPAGQPATGVDDSPRVARVQWAAGIRPARQVWLWDNRIPVGTVSALAGRGGCGKTTYALHLAALLSRGRLPGQHHGQPKPTLVWSGEDQWAPVLVPRLIAAGADLDLIGRLHIEAQDGVEVTPRLPLDTATLRSAVTASGAVLVIIDPIASTMSGDLHREDDVRQALDALARVAADTGAVVMFVRHFGKGGGNASDKMSGSHAFRDAVRSVFLFATDEDRVVVTQDKGNYAPPGGESFAFRLDGTEVDTDTGPAPVARVVELGACEVSVTDIINRAPERTAEAEDDERDYTADFKGSWLYAYLAAAGAANTPVRPKDAVAYAADKGISRRSVFRLFEKLANAGLAVSEDSDGFPRVTHWRVDSGTTGPAHQDGGTTGTTGADLHKHDGTTARSAQDGGTTGGTVADQQEQANTLPVVPVVPPPAGVRAAPAPPGGITENTPGQTARMALALAKATQAVTA